METSISVDIDGAKDWNFLMIKKHFGLTGSSAAAQQHLNVCVRAFRKNNASFLLQCLSPPTLAEAHFSEVLINYMFQTLLYSIFFLLISDDFSSCPVMCRSVL